MREKLILPNIHIEKGRKRYDLHWDNNSTEADNILHENHHFLRGYIKAALMPYLMEKRISDVYQVIPGH